MRKPLAVHAPHQKATDIIHPQNSDTSQLYIANFFYSGQSKRPYLSISSPTCGLNMPNYSGYHVAGDYADEIFMMVF